VASQSPRHTLLGYAPETQEIFVEIGGVEVEVETDNMYSSRVADDYMDVHVVKFLQARTCIATGGLFEKGGRSEKSSILSREARNVSRRGERKGHNPSLSKSSQSPRHASA
jgi:hypothetical protein